MATNLVFCFLVLTLFSLCGMGLVVPFRAHLKYVFAAAIPAGLIALSVLSLAVQVVTQIRFPSAVAASASGLIAIGVIACVTTRTRPNRATVLTILMAIALSILGGATMLHREMDLGSPALVFGAGSDQFGYAQFADWLLGHPGNAMVNADPADAFGSWLDVMLKFDPRAGTFSFLAIISNLSGRSGMFSYNLACTIALITASLGLAGVYSRNSIGFVLVCGGIFFSTWYNLATSGYMGKLVGYPSILFSVGIVFLLVRQTKASGLSGPGLLSALIIAVAASIVFNGMAAVTLLLSIGLALMAITRIFEFEGGVKPTYSQIDLLTSLFIVSAAAFFASGTVARPLYVTNAPFTINWPMLWAQATEVLGSDSPLSILSPATLAVLPWIAVSIWLLIAGLALWHRQVEASALMVASTCIAGSLTASGQGWKFYETTTLYIPLALCATALIISPDEIKKRWHKSIGLGCAAAVGLIALGIPRFVTVYEYTVGSKAYPLFTFSKSEMDELLSRVTTGGGANIESADVSMISPLVLEMTRRNIPYQLSQAAWGAFVGGYRPWPAPVRSEPFSLTISDRTSARPVDGRSEYSTRQYVLTKTLK